MVGCKGPQNLFSILDYLNVNTAFTIPIAHNVLLGVAKDFYTEM